MAVTLSGMARIRREGGFVREFDLEEKAGGCSRPRFWRRPGFAAQRSAERALVQLQAEELEEKVGAAWVMRCRRTGDA